MSHRRLGCVKYSTSAQCNYFEDDKGPVYKPSIGDTPFVKLLGPKLHVSSTSRARQDIPILYLALSPL